MEHYIVIGACSLCGCNVTVPRTWRGVQPAPARCEGCHAEAEVRPTIQMKREQPKPVQWCHKLFCEFNDPLGRI